MAAALLLAFGATLCFSGFNEIVHLTFSNINYIQIIQNASMKNTCVNDFLCQIDVPVQSVQHTMEFKPGATENYIIFYSDEEGQNLQSIILKDLYNKFPCYSNVLIVHFNVGLQQEADGIVKVAFQNFVLNVAILCVYDSGNISLSRNINNMSEWLPSMRNQTLRIALFNYEPLVYYTSEQGLYDGIEMKILEQIIKDWDVIYVEHEANAWQNLHDDVAQGRVDMVLCGFWSDSVNFTTVDMTLYYTQSCSTFVVPKPRLIPLTYSYILQSFHLSLYLILFITIVILSCVLKLFATSDHKTYSQHFLSVYQIIINASANPFPKACTLRLILASWCLCAILINVFYNAGLTKRLSFPRFPPPVNTFADMQQQDVKWLLKSPSIWPLINCSQNYYKRNLVNLLVGSDTKGIDDRDVDFSKFAAPANIVHKFIDISLQRIETLAMHAKPLKECLSNSYFVFPLKKHTPIKRIFDTKLQQITQAGLVEAWFNQFAYKHYEHLKLMPMFYQTYHTYPDLQGPRVLRLAHVQGAFVILIVGYIMSLLILIKERLL